VLFWNALVPHKILLADALLDVPVFDVSPGEMYFTSLDRHFVRPRPGLPYRDGRAYGSRLAGVIVKYAAEAPRAAEVLGAPVHVIPNGVPILDGRPARRDRSGPVILGTAARLSPQKNLEALLAALRRAAPRMPPHLLRIAGTAERGGEAYAAGLRAQAEGLAVEWAGELEGTEGFLAGLDAFVMISEPAGCPNASLEAMAAALPVVATDVGGASEQVVDGVTGRLVPRRDEEALAAAIVEVASDAVLRRRMGEAGRARVEARFSLARMVADYRRVCLGEDG
jgi:glycosyltransferase involved in cell wall biosynthesis